MSTRLHDVEQVLRRRVRAAAAAEFAGSGFAAARVDTIARISGVQTAVVQRIAGKKDELYAAVLLDNLAETLAYVAPGVATARSPEGRLRAAVEGIAIVASENPHFAPLLLREIASGGASLPIPVVAQMELLLRILSHTLSQGAAGGVFRSVDPLLTLMAMAGSLLAVVSGAPIAARLGRDDLTRHPERLAAFISDLLLDGLRPHCKPANTPTRGDQ